MRINANLHRTAGAGLGCLLLAALSLGCETVTKAKDSVVHEPYSVANYSYDNGGHPVSYKRFERHPQRDFLHHFVRTAYHVPSSQELLSASAGEQGIIQEWGNPEYIRKSFYSIEDQRIDEWLYVKQAHLFQFRDGELVYDGPLTDYELTLLRRGYPDQATAIHTESAPRTDIFIYNDVFNPGLENFKFSEGYLVQSKEGD